LIIKTIAVKKPTVLRDTFNSCLKFGLFPLSWKVAKLVLLRKGEKPLENPSTYRPICLLNTAGKLFERIIKRRLEKHLGENGDLNEKQFGFRRGLSTVDAIEKVMEVVETAGSGPLYRRELCAVVALDVANAFNSAKWSKIEESLRDKGMPQYLVGVIRSYLSDRSVQYEGNSWATTCGVPQGSVLGPTLWNLMYDDLLRTDTGGNDRGTSSTTLVAFADDVAVVVTGHTSHILETVCNKALDIVSEWMRRAGLSLSVGKTEAVILTTKRGYEIPQLRIQGVDVTIKESITYLGVELHRVLGFGTHIKTASAKAQATASALSRILPNIGGSGQNKRKLLSTVVTSKLLYASPIWVGALDVKRNVEELQRPQRVMAIRIIRAYKKISTAAAMVIAGLVPAHLLAWKRSERHRRKSEGDQERVKDVIREEVIHRWQQEWNREPNGQWTRSLIKDLSAWLNRKHGTVDFHTTQMLSGHGCFGKYLWRFKKLENPRCIDCGDPTDDAEHVMFRCGRWERDRRALEVELEEPIGANNIVQVMLKRNKNWEAVKRFVGKVQSRREEEERIRQKRNL